MVRFIHTADWQLGMTRHFLSAQSQPRFTDARLDAIAAIGRLALDADFVIAIAPLTFFVRLPRSGLRRRSDATCKRSSMANAAQLASPLRVAFATERAA